MKNFFGTIFGSAILLASASGAFAAGGYLQASSEEDQIIKEANKPQMVTMPSTDAAKGIKNNKGQVILDQTGTYFTIVGVQVGSRGGTGLVRLWFQTNGKDVDNSNCEQLVPTADFTTVMISQEDRLISRSVSPRGAATAPLLSSTSAWGAHSNR
jgi:hypothetical protein